MRILVDGYNLARPEGTGVATYSRGFIKAAQRLGHDLNILFGLERRLSELEQSPLSELNAHRGQLPIICGTATVFTLTRSAHFDAREFFPTSEYLGSTSRIGRIQFPYV